MIHTRRCTSSEAQRHDGRTRYGFTAEDTANVDTHLATYNPSGTVSGIDDRSIITVLVSAIKKLASQMTTFAEKIVTHLLAADRVETQELCVDDVCVTRDQFAKVFGNQSAAAADAPNAGIASRASDGPPASAEADDMGTTSSSTTPNTQPPVITINGNNPAEIQVGDTYADLGATVEDDHDHNLGLHLYIDGVSADVVQLDTSTPGDHTIDYVASDNAGNSATSTRTVIVSAPANDNIAPETDTATSTSPEELPATGTE